MTDEFDDANTAPPRRVRGTERDRSTVVDDTIMTSRAPRADLVEPARERPSVRALHDAVGLQRRASEPVPHTGLYSFRVGDDSDSVILDAPARIGREPAVSRIVVGVAPKLIRVASPNHEVSGTHLEVRQVGSSVIVTDLRSTNGSVVTQPGSAPRKLRQGESVVVSPGTLVDIGDENIIQILPMQRLG